MYEGLSRVQRRHVLDIFAFRGFMGCLRISAFDVACLLDP